MERVFPEFTVGNFRKVSYGKVRLLFDLVVGPITLRDCNIVVDEAGKPKFAAPRRIREAFSNQFIGTADVDRAFMRTVFDAVANEMRSRATKPPSEGASSWVEEQESRFEGAFAKSGGAS